eukprot:760685-Hanusia_phi.AAC.3
MEEVNAEELKRQRVVRTALSCHGMSTAAQNCSNLQDVHEQAISDLRDRMLAEREKAIERERELASNRLREQNERFDQQLQAQRIRMTEDMAQERERIEAAHRSERQRIENMYGMQVMDDSRKLAIAQREWSEKEQELQRRHAAEMGKLREQLEIEKEQWILHVIRNFERFFDSSSNARR